MDSGLEAECKEIAREIIKEVISEHIDTCPHHMAFKLSRAKLFGIIMGVILASGATSSAAAAFIFKILGM